MFNPRMFENARPDGFPVLEIVPPPGDPEEQPQPRLFVPLQRTDLIGEIVGPVAALRLAQHFLFTREQQHTGICLRRLQQSVALAYTCPRRAFRAQRKKLGGHHKARG